MIKGLKFYLPLLAPALVVVAFTIYVLFLDSTECAFLLGISSSLIALLMFCFVLPIIFAIASLYFFYFSLKTRGHDTYPPPGIPWASIFNKLSGKRAKIAQLLGYLLPVASVWIIWLGITSFAEISDGRTLTEMSTTFGAVCQRV